MQPVSPNASRYDATSMVLHWLTALLVASQWLGAQIIDDFPRGPIRVDVRSMHISFGLLLTLLIACRLFWRATAGRRLRPADRGGLHVVAKATHWTLYGLLVAMVLAGMTLASARHDSYFNLFRVPPLFPGIHALSHRVQALHATIGWLIVGLAGLHAGAALVHRFVWRDAVLARMLPAGRTSRS